MGYFNNPRTKAELDDQCRKLLFKYDYRSGKNSSITDEILKEYKALEMQIKRANGYRTPVEKAASAVKNAAGSYVQAKQMELQKEQQRIDRLKNHHYTKEETQALILECKKMIAGMLKNSAMERTVFFDTFDEIVRDNDDEYVTRYFNNHTSFFASVNAIQTYDETREKLEYALKSAARDVKTQETYMLKSEKLFGAFIKKKYFEYQELYYDPIEIAKKVSSYQKGLKSERLSNTLFGIMVGQIFGLPILFIFSESGTALGQFVGVSGDIIVTALITIVVRKCLYSFNKKNFDGLGERKRKSRMSEKKKYKSDLRKRRLGYLIFSLFR